MSHKNVKLVKLSKSRQSELKENIEQHFNLKNFQTYFPSMIYWEDFENNTYSKQLFTLDSKYQLDKLERKSDKSESELDFLGYITKKNTKVSKSNQTDEETKTDVVDELNSNNSCNRTKHEIHFKINPLLEPIGVMMNEYQLESNGLMPSVFDYLTNKKINSPHNFSYVETLFAYLASSLVEKGKCPSFPYFYGSYLGVMDKFKTNISEEYHSLKKSSWFNENNNTLFSINKVSVEEELNNIHCEPIDLEEQKNKDDTIGVESIDFDLIDMESSNKNKKKQCNSLNNEVESEAEAEEITNLKELDSLNLELDKDKEEEKEEEAEEEEKEEKEEEKEEEDDKEEKEEDEEESEWEDYESEEGSEEEGSEEEGSEEEDSEEEDSEEEGSEEEGSEEGSDDDGDDESDIFEELDDADYYASFNNFPVQLIAMEKMSMTLSELLKKKKINDQEWLAILFQVIFGLSVAQKNFNFTHNDLHSDNIMLKPTKIPYLYFHINKTYFRIPTFGKITKIIDFARAVFKVDEYRFFSDVFKKEGDADGQYTYPYTSSTKIKYSPNYSFDLSYLAITIAEHFEEKSPIFKLIDKWTTDKYNNDLKTHEVNFDLYIKIAHNMTNAIPLKQIEDDLFKQFIIKKSEIPAGNYIYYY
jgi:hypothetical protein